MDDEILHVESKKALITANNQSPTVNPEQYKLDLTMDNSNIKPLICRVIDIDDKGRSD